ncbi:MAG: PQQ-binding-like beta-propeller repeat protein [Synergistaceae bacterium]|nr:PQQ-binding-like beta-propeller repeat protein [Synergistaceae bacterium]
MKRKVILAIFTLAVILSAFQASAFEAKTKWSYQTAGAPTGGLKIYNDLVIFGDWTGQIYALNKSSGAVAWTYKDDNENATVGTPVVAEGRVFFAYANGEVICLKASDGSLVWRNRPYEDDLGFGDGLAAGKSLVFAAKLDGKIQALDQASGHVVWTHDTGRALRTAPGYGDGFLFLGEDDGIFSIIDAKKGERINGGGAGGAINTPVSDKGNVYFSAWDNSVQAVQLKDVIPLWKADVKDPVSTPPAISHGIIVVGTARSLIVALSQDDGRILWTRDLQNGTIKAKPVIADGVVFAGAEGGNIYGFDVKTGEVRFTFETEFGIDAEPAYSDGVFYFANEQHTVYAVQ